MEDDAHMAPNPDIRVRKPVGAVLSVRVPRSLAISADEIARQRSMTLSELIRVAVEGYIANPAPRVQWSIYGSTIPDAGLVLNVAAVLAGANRGRAQTETWTNDRVEKAVKASQQLQLDAPVGSA